VLVWGPEIGGGVCVQGGGCVVVHNTPQNTHPTLPARLAANSFLQLPAHTLYPDTIAQMIHLQINHSSLVEVPAVEVGGQQQLAQTSSIPGEFTPPGSSSLASLMICD
jgi:hypothetical protein